MLSITVLACYLASALWLAAGARSALDDQSPFRPLIGIALGVLGLGFHAAKLWRDLSELTEFALSAGDTASLIAWITALIALFTAARIKSFAVPSAVLLALAGIIAAGVDPSVRNFTVTRRGWELTAHIVLSTLAYALLTVGAALAVASAVLDRRLRAHRPLGNASLLPPLQSLEVGMFRAIAGGFALLSLALFSGFVFVEDLFAQHLVHKTVLACVAWLLFAVLLIGRWYFGWRGRTALRWSIGGYGTLALAYFGSKLVLESLGRHWG